MLKLMNEHLEHLHETKDLFDHLHETKDLFDHLHETKDLFDHLARLVCFLRYISTGVILRYVTPL